MKAVRGIAVIVAVYCVAFSTSAKSADKGEEKLIRHLCKNIVSTSKLRKFPNAMSIILEDHYYHYRYVLNLVANQAGLPAETDDWVSKVLTLQNDWIDLSAVKHDRLALIEIAGLGPVQAIEKSIPRIQDLPEIYRAESHSESFHAVGNFDPTYVNPSP
jgi:hypothetical protein